MISSRLLNKLLKYVQISLIARSHLRKNGYDVVIAMGYSGFALAGPGECTGFIAVCEKINTSK